VISLTVVAMRSAIKIARPRESTVATQPQLQPAQIIGDDFPYFIDIERNPSAIEDRRPRNLLALFLSARWFSVTLPPVDFT
jgi:hypothetical protein